MKFLVKTLCVGLALTACKSRQNNSDLLGVEDGNGGTIVKCESPTRHLGNRQAMLLDYYNTATLSDNELTEQEINLSDIVAKLDQKKLAELAVDQRDHVPFSKELVSDEFGEKQLAIAVEGAKLFLESRFPEVGSSLQEFLLNELNFFVEETIIAPDLPIAQKQDYGLVSRLPSGCDLLQIAAYYPSSTRNKVFGINLSEWEVLDWESRIGLVVHEVLYRIARTYLKHETSEKIQVFNYGLASGELKQKFSKENDPLAPLHYSRYMTKNIEMIDLVQLGRVKLAISHRYELIEDEDSISIEIERMPIQSFHYSNEQRIAKAGPHGYKFNKEHAYLDRNISVDFLDLPMNNWNEQLLSGIKFDKKTGHLLSISNVNFYEYENNPGEAYKYYDVQVLEQISEDIKLFKQTSFNEVAVVAAHQDELKFDQNGMPILEFQLRLQDGGLYRDFENLGKVVFMNGKFRNFVRTPKEQ